MGIKMSGSISVFNFKIECNYSILKTGVCHLFFNLISKDFCFSSVTVNCLIFVRNILLIFKTLQR